MLRILAHILFIRPFLMLFSGVTVIGRENLSHLKRFVIIANHNSHLDIFLLFGLLPVRDILRTHAVADKAYFTKSRLLHAIVQFLFRPVFVTRGKLDRTKDPLEEIKQMIDKNHNVIIFPEGTRGNPGELRHFKSGIGRLVAEYPDLPIVPVFLSGPERALPKASSLFLPFWNFVVVGPTRSIKGSHRDITGQLEEALYDLSQTYSQGRHKQRAKRSHHPQSIAFLGIDGSGKSTISRMTALELSGRAKTALVSDKLEIFEESALKNLQPFITEKVRQTISAYAKKARSLKLYKIPKLTELLLRNHLHHELERWYLSDYVVLDGSPLLNMIAWSALYKKDVFDDDICIKAVSILSGKSSAVPHNDPIYTHFPELSYLRNLRLNSLILPDIVVFIDTAPKTACERIDSRGELKQVHETEEKLTELRAAYIKVCDILKSRLNIPVVILSGEDSREEVASQAISFINDTLSQEDKS